MRYRPMLWIAACVFAGAAWSAYEGALLSLLVGYALFAFLFRGSRPSPDLSSSLPFVGEPTFLTRFGVRRSLLLLGMLAVLTGWMRQDQAERARVRGVWRIHHALSQSQDILCAAMPEEAILGHAGRWQTTGWIDPDGRGGIRVRMTGTAPAPIQAGTVLRGRWRMRPVRPPLFPGGFDFGHYLKTRGLSAQLDLVELEAVRPPVTVRAPLYGAKRILEGIRAHMIRVTHRHVGGGTGAFLNAAIYGYRKELSPSIRESFRAVGVGHLLAISGLHMGLVVGMAWWIVRRRVGDIRIAALVGIGVCLLYLSLCGGRIAAVRAAVIAVLYLGGMALGRRCDFLNSVGAAAVLILLVTPDALSDLGFQLSFTAVIFIARFHHEAWKRQEREAEETSPVRARPWRHRVLALLLMSVAAWMGVTPLVAHAFHVVTPIGLVVNPLAIPWMSLVLAGGMLLPCVEGLPTPLVPYVSAVLALPARVLLAGLEWLRHAPGAHVGVTPPAPEWVAGYYLGFLLVFIRDAFAGRARVVLGLVGLALALGAGGWMVHTGMRPPLAHPGRVHLLPYGQGEIVLFEVEERRTVLVGTWTEASRRLVRSYLEERALHMPGLVYAFADMDGQTAGDIPSDDSDATADPDPQSLPRERYAPRVFPIPRSAPPDGAARWLPLEGTAYRMFLSRERDGRLVWCMFTDGSRSFLLTGWMWEGQMRYRMERNFPGTGADVAVLRMRGDPGAILESGRWRHAFRMGRPPSTAPEPGGIDRDESAPGSYGVTDPLADAESGERDGAEWEEREEDDPESVRVAQQTRRHWREAYGVLWLLPSREGYELRGFRQGRWSRLTGDF